MRRASLLLTLAAWLLATGAQWDLVQVYAWGQMFAGNVREMNVTSAIAATMSGRMCPICAAVQKAKQQEAESNAAPAGKIGRPEFVASRPATVYGPALALATGRVIGMTPLLGTLRGTPLLPPPRVWV